MKLKDLSKLTKEQILEVINGLALEDIVPLIDDVVLTLDGDPVRTKLHEALRDKHFRKL